MGVGFEAGGGLAVADAVVVGPLAKEVFMDIGACGDELPELGVLVVLLWVLLLLLFEFELEAPEWEGDAVSEDGERGSVIAIGIFAFVRIFDGEYTSRQVRKCGMR
jgi:hypothetical protein